MINIKKSQLKQITIIAIALVVIVILVFAANETFINSTEPVNNPPIISPRDPKVITEGELLILLVYAEDRKRRRFQ